MNAAEAHHEINELLEGTQYGATTTEVGRDGVLSCRVLVRWWPAPGQILKRPKVCYEAERPSWREVVNDCRTWIENEHGKREP